jgi:hypothetical protein
MAGKPGLHSLQALGENQQILRSENCFATHAALMNSYTKKETITYMVKQHTLTC